MPTHTIEFVYSTMLGQICIDIACLPDPRTLTMGEIRWFYDVLRASLKRLSTK